MGPTDRPTRRSLTIGVMALAVAASMSACAGAATAPGAALGPASSTPPASASATAPTPGLATPGLATPGPATPGPATPLSTPAPVLTPTRVSTANTTPAAGPAGSVVVPVYWIGESRRSFALYREFRTVPDAGTPIASAVAAVTRAKPLDPDYLTPWRAASRVTARQAGDAITVDLSADAFANTQVGSALAERAVQQVVYTATAAAQNAGHPASTVTITVDGKPYDAWGAVRLGDPMKRAEMSAVQAHTWVTTPQEGDTVPAGQVVFKGSGTSFEANFPWEIHTAVGTVVAKGFTTGGGGGTFGELTFTVNLKPGSYTVKLSADDASGGAEGPGAATDDKRFTVR